MNLLYTISSLVCSSGFGIIHKHQIPFFCYELKDYVDLIIVCPEYNICIKDYWTFNNINQNIIQTYINISIQLNINSTNKRTYIVLLKKNTEKQYNQKYDIKDYKYQNSEYLYVIEKNSIDKLISHFTMLMYSNNIFFYESDGSAIMLNFI